MNGNFKVKFEDKPTYLKGLNDFMKMLDTWKNKESKFERNFNIKPTAIEEDNRYEIDIEVEVNKI